MPHENTPPLTVEEILCAKCQHSYGNHYSSGCDTCHCGEDDTSIVLHAYRALQQQVKELKEGASRADGEAILKAKGEAWEECAAKAYESTGMTRTAARVLHALNPYPLPSSTPTTPDA